MVLFGNQGRRAQLLGTLLLVVTFVAGGLAGAAVVRVLSAEKPEARKAEPREGSRMRGGPRRLLLDDAFAQEIGLSADQRADIKAILDRRDVEARALWQSFEPKMQEFGKRVHDEIAQVLTAEQQKQLDAAIEQRRFEKKKRECKNETNATSATNATKERNEADVSKQ